MIVVCNIFQLKFGKARDAIAILEKGADRYRRLGVEMRLVADVTGPFYTLVDGAALSEPRGLRGEHVRACGRCRVAC